MGKTQLDYMEYADDAAAQAAYVDDSSDEYGGTIASGDVAFSGGYTGINEDATYRIGKAGTVGVVKYYTTTAGNNVKIKVFRINGTDYDFVGESEVFTTVAGGATRVLTTPITGVQSGDIIGLYVSTTIQNMKVSTGKNGISYILGDVTGTTAIATWASEAIAEWAFSCVLTDFQCFSEDTIKEQGSYSLKGIALITTSLNNTLTRTVDPTIDLTDLTQIKFDIRASRTGSHIKIGIHDSGGTTTEHTANIAQANVNQTETWDISGISNANKDAIDSIIITIINADANNIFYVDNMYAEAIFEYVGTGTFSYSGSGICHYEKAEWEYVGSGELAYSGEAIQSYTKDFLYDTSGILVFSGTGIYSIGFAFTGSGSLIYSGEAEKSYTYNFSYVTSGDFVFSGSGICHYEKAEWEYTGSGELAYSGAAIVSIGFASIGSGTYTFSGVGLYSLGLSYIGIGEFVYSGSAIQVFTWCYLYAGSGVFTYSGEAVLRWGDWAKITKETSDFTEIEKGTSNWKKTIKL